MFAGIRDIVGGRSAAYERELQRAKDLAISEMVERARDMGSNAVIETHASRSHAELMFSHPAAREAMERDGVDISSLWLDYFDEID
jgi:uncharacterized protein YbjQ (UPF0145 family)